MIALAIVTICSLVVALLAIRQHAVVSIDIDDEPDTVPSGPPSRDWDQAPDSIEPVRGMSIPPGSHDQRITLPSPSW